MGINFHIGEDKGFSIITLMLLSIKQTFSHSAIHYNHKANGEIINAKSLWSDFA